MYAVCVTFHLHENASEQFLELMMEQARNSLTLEPQCHHFDVCASDDGQSVFLYELYTDRAAFDAHLRSDHFKSFDAAVKALVADKEVKTYTLVSPKA